jgi:hypothetical protein
LASVLHSVDGKDRGNVTKNIETIITQAHSILKKMPIFYQCQRCTACCKWPGEVRVSNSEITAISTFLHLVEAEFIQKHTRIRKTRSGLALRDKANGECQFLRGGDCSINEVKPQQCRDFPTLWRTTDFDKYCKAIPMEMDPETYRRKVFEVTGRWISVTD